MAKYFGLPFNLQVSKNLTQGEKEALHKAAVGKHLAGKMRGAAKAVPEVLDQVGLPFETILSSNLTVAEKDALFNVEAAKRMAQQAGQRTAGRAAARSAAWQSVLAQEAAAPPLATLGVQNGVGPKGGIPGFGGGKVPKDGWGKFLKWGGRAAGVAGLGLTALAILEGIRKERDGGVVDALRGLDEGSKAAQLEMALQSEQSLNSRLGVMEGAAGRLERDAATRQGFDEAELMGMLRDRAGELDAIAERYQPDLATRMARLGVL